MGVVLEVPAVRELRVVVDVAEVLHGYGFDADGLELLGHIEAGVLPSPRLDVGTGDRVEPRELVVVSACDRAPAVAYVTFVGARKRAVQACPRVVVAVS